MEIKINIDEQKILELAQTNSIEDLPRSIWYQAKADAIASAVKELKDKLVGRPYYDNKERLYDEVSNELWKSIEASVKNFVEKKFNDEALQMIIERHADKVITDWLEKKIYSRLEELKKDIFIGSYGEIEAERQEMERIIEDRE